METANRNLPNKETYTLYAEQKKIGQKSHSTDVIRKSPPKEKDDPFLIQDFNSPPKDDENPTGNKKNATSREKNISYDMEDPTIAYGAKYPEHFKDEYSFRIERNGGLVRSKMNKSYN